MLCFFYIEIWTRFLIIMYSSVFALFVCSSTYSVQTYYFLQLKKNRERIRIRGGAKCIGILILAGELGFFGQNFGPPVS